jgi:hypothetical protein
MVQMASQGKLSMPTDSPKQVKVVDYSLFDPGVISFRLRGDSTIYWTNFEAISN